LIELLNLVLIIFDKNLYQGTMNSTLRNILNLIVADTSYTNNGYTFYVLFWIYFAISIF